MKRAFRVTCPRWGSEVDAIAAADSAAAARVMSVRSSQDAGYDLSFADFRVRRAREFDAWAANAPPYPVGEDYARRELATSAQADRRSF